MSHYRTVKADVIRAILEVLSKHNIKNRYGETYTEDKDLPDDELCDRCDQLWQDISSCLELTFKD